MANYEEKMLVALVESYRRSKKDSGTNVIARRTKISPTDLYKGYNRNNGDMDEIEAVNLAAEQCQKKGFLTFETVGFSSEIRALYLVDSKIEEVEQYLERTYQYESKASKRRYVEHMIEVYDGRTPAAAQECEKLRKALEKNKIPSKYQQTEDLLKALVFIEANEKDLFLREASMLIYGDSKYLEDSPLFHQVCKALRDCKKQPCGEEELEDEILEEYHITREKQKLCLKGDAAVRISGRELDLGAFSNGFEFFTEDLKQLEWIHVSTPEFMTIENRTSFLRMHMPNATLLYLGGYASRYQREFLKKVYSDNPGLVFQHFGDLDAGGLYIHEHLCRVTGIPFEMYRMSQHELANPRYQACLHTLTERDRTRLKSLGKQEVYREVVSYMLEHGVKLEQEIISYFEEK